MKSVLCRLAPLLLVVSFALGLQAPVNCSQYQVTRQLDPLLTLDYVVNVDDDGKGTFRCRMTLEGLSWIGFGHSEGGMVPGQSVVGSDVGVFKYFHTGKSPESVNPTLAQTLTDTTFVQNETHTVLEFTKLLVEEGELPIKIGMNNFIYARGISNTLGFHRLGGYGNAPFEIQACGTVEKSAIPFIHKAFKGYKEPSYFPFYENLLGADYLKRCVKRQNPPKGGDICREKLPKACLWGEQTCQKNSPGGHTHPVTRCNCIDGRWNCFNVTCPTIQVPDICPLFDPSNLDPPTICTRDMTCDYEEMQCCGKKIPKNK